MGDHTHATELHRIQGRKDHVWATEIDAVAAALDSDLHRGLSEAEAARRLECFGPNLLRRVRPRSVWKIFVDQIDDLVIAFLLVTAIVALVLGYRIEGIAVGFVVLITTVVGMTMELRARRSMQALRELAQVVARVVRDGQAHLVSAETLVPGDLVLLEEGDVVSADLRLVEASRLQISEAALTGESLPVEKEAVTIEDDTILAERKNMLFSGTAVTRGTGKGIVVATGMETELGEISALVEVSQESGTPLEKRLNHLASSLIWVTLALSALVFPAGLVAGQPVELIATTAIALAIATVPEGLPVVATLTLARGMVRMARHNALMRRLASVETLGATTLICTDKTGTLTENHMAVETLWVDDMRIEQPQRAGEEIAHTPTVRQALETATLCNNAHLRSDGETVGDPMEVALLETGAAVEVDRIRLEKALPRVREEAFDSVTRMMATFHREDAAFRVVVKGAPEEVLEASTHYRGLQGLQELNEKTRRRWHQRNQELSSEGLRVLALAFRHTDKVSAAPYEELVFQGLVAFSDPPREDVSEALDQCRRAGIRVVMVTGDQIPTARHIAAQIGLIDPSQPSIAVEGRALASPEQLTPEERQELRKATIFARVSPRQKLTLIALHQEDDQVVAMTGDGVNDAPALTRADIGVAMGLRGTQVAREASDLILQDDRFATIVRGIEEGRLIFANIRRFVIFLLSINFASILAITIASLVGAPIPVTPLQILYLNMFTDLFPALALVTTGGAAALMDQPPRPPKEPVLASRHWLAIAGYGALMAACVLASLAIALLWLDVEAPRAVTISFLTLGFAKAFHALNMRGATWDGQPRRRLANPVLRNHYVWAAIVLCLGLLVMAVYLPWLSGLLDTFHPGTSGWLLIVTLSLVPLVFIQLSQFVAGYTLSSRSQ